MLAASPEVSKYGYTREIKEQNNHSKIAGGESIISRLFINGVQKLLKMPMQKREDIKGETWCTS